MMYNYAHFTATFTYFKHNNLSHGYIDHVYFNVFFKAYFCSECICYVPHQFSFNMFDPHVGRVFQNRFSTQYRCYSVSMLAGPNDRSDVEKGGKSGSRSKTRDAQSFSYEVLKRKLEWGLWAENVQLYRTKLKNLHYCSYNSLY